jgi:glycosyltransferase involved in cell wall biosynthesis
MKKEFKKTIYLSVIIPCYNEAANLERGVLSEVRKYLSKVKRYSWEVIISDDGSTDESREIIKTKIKKWDGFRLLENKHGGKPSALFFGIKAARGKYVLFTDMDQSTPINQLEKLLVFLKDKYKVVIGSRGLQRKNFPLYRRMGSIVFMTFRKLIMLPEIDDTQCGFKVFERSVVIDAFPKLEFFRKKEEVAGWSVTSYDVELLHIVRKLGHEIKEVVVEWNDEDISESKGGGVQRYTRESREMLSQILRVKLNDIKGLYD